MQQIEKILKQVCKALLHVALLLWHIIIRITVSLYEAIRFFVQCVAKGPAKVKEKQQASNSAETLRLGYLLAEEKDKLKKKEDELYAMRLSLKKKDETINGYESDFRNLTEQYDTLNASYEEFRGILYKVSTEEVAKPFCLEFENITSLIAKTEDKALQMYMPTSNSEVLMKYMKGKKTLHTDGFYSWYLTLKSASSLTGEAAADVSGKKSVDLQLEYLRRLSFTQYYRPCITSLIMFLEQMRINEDGNECDAVIHDFVKEMSDVGIKIDYIATGQTYNETDFENVLIADTDDEKAKKGEVFRVERYGVNTTNIETPHQQTKVIMNL